MIGATRLTTGFDLIDGVTKDINLAFSPNLTAARILEVDMSNYIVLKLKIIFWCAPGYEGENCSVSKRNFSCDPGWTGDGCEDKDECKSNPCLHGICQNTIGSFICKCDESWSGPLCQTFHDCWLNPCRHGICNELDKGGYNCVCDPGYTGYNCSVNIDDCVSHSCMNNATCIDGVNNFTCACLPGFVGNLCENNICENVSCSGDHGVCQILSGQDPRGYECICKRGWTGLFCERDQNECLERICEHNGTCINVNGSFSCSCSQFWTGEKCELDIDECSSSPCKNQGTCHNQKGANFTCTCDGGWTGSECSINLNECNRNPNSCLHGKCVDTPGSYRCDCENGWIGENCSKDKNECQDNLNICGKGNCTNSSGGYECTCYSGFKGPHCSDDIDECLVVSCGHGKCMNFPGGYNCVCEKGYNGTHCEEHVYECTESPCKNNARCTNLPGDFNCTCSPGWSGRNCTIPNDQHVGKCDVLQVKFAYSIQHSLENKMNSSIQAFMKKSTCPFADMDTKVFSINESLIRFKTTCGGICVTESQLQTALKSLSTSDKSAMFPIALADNDPTSAENDNSDPLNQIWVPVLIGCLIAFTVIVAIGVILYRRKNIR
ncbi:hypothetical protein ACJMK2_016685 [Sinanodonta woodiana]|uniref:EGF-like domain-containing protein n=1 Tax=Sinanodonta woodiana TaxID=1069815 RepID=A0ABD3UXJ7_SINWO